MASEGNRLVITRIDHFVVVVVVVGALAIERSGILPLFRYLHENVTKNFSIRFRNRTQQQQQLPGS